MTTNPSIVAKSLVALSGIVIFVGVAGAVEPVQAPGAQSQAAAASSTSAPAATQDAHFDVHEYRVLGNTVFTNREIESVLYPLLGDHKTLSDVEVARAALEKAYHDRGFGTVFVDIPEQEVSEKIVRLKVSEGRVHEVHISGARYFSERKILAAVPAATVGTVPNIPVLQQQLSVVNVTTADRSVVPILRAGPLPATVDLSLRVDDHLPFHGSLEMDNQYTPGTKPLRMAASLSYSNLFGRFDNFSIQYQVSPQAASQVTVFAANYAWGALENGVRPSIYFIDNSSNVPTVGTLGVLGKGQIYGSRLGFPLTDALISPQSITLGADYKHFDQTINLKGTPGLNTPISYVNLSVAYAGNWSSDKLIASSVATANFGPRGIPNNQDTFANKRYKGNGNYFYVKLDDSLTVLLPMGFKLILRADGQYAVEPLILNEDFSITGADGVRGYYEAESLSDIGIKGTVQVQSRALTWKTVPLGDVFVFYDAGRANELAALPGEPATTELRSFGAGLDVFPGKPVAGTLTWAHALVTGLDTHRGDSRLLFIVRGAF
jgi:hemolysin activation/secretion protein